MPRGRVGQTVKTVTFFLIQGLIGLLSYTYSCQTMLTACLRKRTVTVEWNPMHVLLYIICGTKQA